MHQPIFSQNEERIRIVPTELCSSSPRNNSVGYHQSQYPPFMLFSLLLWMAHTPTGPLSPFHCHFPGTRAAVPPVSIGLVDSLVHVLLEVCEFWKGNKRLG